MGKLKVLCRVIRREALMLLFRCFPVKKNRVFLMSYYGKYMNCNPYAIYSYLKKNHPQYEFVWVYNGENPEETVKIASYRSVKYYYYLRTSGFLIFNARPGMDIKKRKNQFYIQTWHSSLGFKMIEKDAPESLGRSYIKNAIKDSKNIDLLISGCRFRTDCFKRNFWYDGKIAEVGTPRNDVLFAENAEEIVRQTKAELGIDREAKILLYAPTFRSNGDVDYAKSLDVSALKKALQEKMGGQWEIVFRLHPNVVFNDGFDPQIVNASTFGDMQALLMSADVVMTDYSSVMFDFMLLKRPCFLYCPDIEEYTKQERKTYFTVRELPFDLAKTNDELVENISTFDADAYMRKLNGFAESIGSFETGKACESIARIMENIRK